MTEPERPGGELLATKLHAPRRRREIVSRPRLTTRWSAAEAPVLTLVAGPAGFGKTTLLTEWFAVGDGSTRSTGWLALDAGDNDPAVFGAYLVAALRSIDPALGATTTPPPTSLQATVAMLINHLHAADRNVVLVLDDYHVIDAAEVHDAVTFLVDHAPPRFALVMASRADPPLPLARWRVRRDLLEIRAADLRFTRDEAASYFNDALGFDLAAAEVGALEARTEGWIAALQLAALSMHGRDDVAAFIDTFTGDDRFVVDYLVEEVLERQTPEVRSFLLQTSVLSRLTGPLCDAVTGGTNGRATLEMLDRANLFLVALDDRRRWYRYHHLFADVLRAQLLDEHPELIAELHLRASLWHEHEGDTADAVQHAMAGRHFARAAQLIELAAPRLRRTRQERTLRAWLEALPATVFEDRPVLALALVGAHMSTGSTRGVGPLLDLVEATLARVSPAPIVYDHELFARLPAQVAIQRAGLALLAGDLEATTAHARRALDLIDDADHLQRGSATALLGLTRWATGELAAAERLYTDAIGSLVAADHLADALGCSLALADIQMAQGRLGDAIRTFETGLRWTSEHPGLRGAADMHVGLSEVLIERDDLDLAARHLATSTDLGDAAGLPQHAYRWRVTMARLCRARGDLDGALELLDAAAPLYDTDFSPPVRPVAALRARVHLARGDVDAARRWVTERSLGPADELGYVREFEHVTCARVLVARHRIERDPQLLDDALALLARLHAAAVAGGRVGTVVEVLVLQADAHLARRDTPKAVAALESALAHAAPEGHVRLFLHAGPAVTSLLRSLSPTGAAATHLRRVLVAVGDSDDRPPATRPTTPTLVDQLSARELDVLRLLRSELSGPEIARELIVSLNTVRTHTKNIYLKLGATNRREAVRRAAELGL